ncbi:hypothetical protein PUN28_009553 [Cardiocondyla obscurior]|uniref:Uncharacterized protein n=1 Tax=Cardiocondyla obscurior TaxID=286306 RepID=A0AAW2FYJ7_9HYME
MYTSLQLFLDCGGNYYMKVHKMESKSWQEGARWKCLATAACLIMEQKWKQVGIKTFKDKRYSTALTTKKSAELLCFQVVDLHGADHKGRKEPGAELRPAYRLSHKGCRHVAERRTQTPHSNETRTTMYRSKGKNGN